VPLRSSGGEQQDGASRDTRKSQHSERARATHYICSLISPAARKGLLCKYNPECAQIATVRLVTEPPDEGLRWRAYRSCAAHPQGCAKSTGRSRSLWGIARRAREEELQNETGTPLANTTAGLRRQVDETVARGIHKV
jgi:hypothetical protein